MFTSPIWDTVRAVATPSHPMAKLPLLPPFPPSIPDIRTWSHPALTLGQMHEGFPQPREGLGCSLWVCTATSLWTSMGCRDWGSCGWSRTGGGLSPGMTLKAGLATHISPGPGLWSWLRGLTFLVPLSELGSPNSISQAPFHGFNSLCSPL